ncbi:DNA-binding transcriptional regulator [Plastorhodobacter daqingensis]|uniref:DNA-binding transcriptional regulator n=1 Tax=Plastorhodobacter daqingensis TaxID=1387281 RepID=A0ABW2UN72_9RHOB
MTDAPDPPRKETVRALARGLAVLRHVNAMGAARPSEIAQALGLARPTVYRLLETLEEEGYVTFSASSNRVRVTRLAAALGDGVAITSQICQVAAPVLARHAPKLLWPLDLTVHDNAAMVIQETTHARSPLSIDRGMTGYRLPMLRSSAGRAYLAHCSAGEREIILEHVRRLGEPADLPFLEPGRLNHLLHDVERKGFAIRDGAEFRPHTASIAVPLLRDGAVLGCISIIWIASAMSTAKAIETSFEPLRRMASEIVQGLQASQA